MGLSKDAKKALQKSAGSSSRIHYDASEKVRKELQKEGFLSGFRFTAKAHDFVSRKKKD